MKEIKKTVQRKEVVVLFRNDDGGETTETFYYGTRISRKGIILDLFNKYDENFQIISIKEVDETFVMDEKTFFEHATKIKKSESEDK